MRKMNIKVLPAILSLVISFICKSLLFGQTGEIKKVINNEYDYIENSYKYFHAHPELGEKLKKSFSKAVGEENVYPIPPLMYGEDFGEYGSEKPEIPAFLFSLGSVKPEDMKAAEKGLIDSPSTHSSEYLPDIEPTIRTGILTMSSAVFDLFEDS